MADDTARLWAVLLEVRDNVQATRTFLEGGIKPDGTHVEGFIHDHNKVKADVEALKDQQKQHTAQLNATAAKTDDRRWMVTAGAFGAIIGKGLDALYQWWMHRS